MKSIAVGFRVLFSIAARAAITATLSGTGIDLANQNQNMVVINPGTITDGTHTPVLEESADNATFTAVASTDMVGTLVPITTGVQQKVGYIGSKRYIRVTVTVAGATTGGFYTVEVISHGRKQPQ